MENPSITEQIKSKGIEIGFDLVGIASAKPHKDIAIFDRWLRKGFAGTMNYLKRQRDDRADPKRLLENVKTIICCGLNYYGGEKTPLKKALQGWISRYAWGDDYHDVVLEKLSRLKDFIVKEIDPNAKLMACVDTGPILEKSYAASASLGWIGKNTLLIHPQIGSYFFIGEILSNLELAMDTPKTDHCNDCRLCIESCPTQALSPYEINATRCISYLTIEHRGDIPDDLKNAIGHHIAGCDICQEVCPYNQSIPLCRENAFKPRRGLFHPRLEELEGLDEERFHKTFNKNPIQRMEWKRLKRNLNIVRNNQKRALVDSGQRLS